MNDELVRIRSCDNKPKTSGLNKTCLFLSHVNEDLRKQFRCGIVVQNQERTLMLPTITMTSWPTRRRDPLRTFFKKS